VEAIMQRGFTVLELLVVIAIIVVLVILVIPAIGNVKRAAVRASCTNQLRILGQGMQHYHDAHGHWPPGTVPDTLIPPDQRLSYYTLLLPHIDAMQPVYKKLHRAEPWDSNANRAAITDFNWTLFQCPEWTGAQSVEVRKELAGGTYDYPKHANYVGIAGAGSDAATRPVGAPGIGLFGYDRTVKKEDVKDGLGSTIMLIETGYEVGPWTRGGPTTIRSIDSNAEHPTGGGLSFGGTHYRERIFRPNEANGFHVLLADGSTRYTNKEVAPGVLSGLATIAGGEEIPADW
jgi:prepilin-type N-terminal cleavage/methylation domain-containing protein